MIEEINISNLGVIAEANVALGPGFSVITGETGAGKTMVVTALGLLLGDRADAAIVRTGASAANVTGRILLSSVSEITRELEDAGIDLEDHVTDQGQTSELILGRTVGAEGRSKATVGGRAVPSGMLSEIAEKLVVIHGQADQQRLRSVTAQRDTVDRFGGAELQGAKLSYQVAFKELREASAKLEEIESNAAARIREAEMLREDIAELQKIDPKPGEYDSLQADAARLAGSEELRVAVVGAQQALAGFEDESGARASLHAAAAELTRVAHIDEALGAIGEEIHSLTFQVDEAISKVNSYLAEIEAGGVLDMESIQERIALLRPLLRRFGTLEEAIEVKENGANRLAELEADYENIQLLKEKVAALTEEANQSAGRLTELRKVAGASLGAQVSEELHALAMPEATLIVNVEPLPALTLDGADEVTINLIPHAGAPARPITKSASGGELSRIMLAIEVVLANTSDVPTFVFDEVDAGVGGATAIEIGRRLAKLARTAQVIVVTHLAQVAAFATNHLTVEKASDGSITASSVTQLDGDSRLREIARLLSGLADSASGIEHARELLQEAQT
ncbi:MAG: DNA repair protein RecN [Microbacteriaceae bacterium]|nr:DNA repair protein RecN [Microbacteriaceae bacterium]